MVKTWPKCVQVQKRQEERIKEYQAIKEFHETEGWEIKWMCKVLEISRAAYYKWLHRTPSKRDIENEGILETIQMIYESNNGLFGYRKMTMAINRVNGIHVNEKRVRRLLRTNEMYCSYRRKSRCCWRKSQPEETAENILGRNFHADCPNQKWCTDITEIRIPGKDQKLYISTVIDLYDRYPVAWEISSRNDTDLVNNTLMKALEAYPEGCELFHSDRGFQYTRKEFSHILSTHGIRQSMSRVSRCIDNGPMEGFQGQLKDICRILYPEANTIEEMRQALEQTFRFYINEYPQKRFGGKTAGEVRHQALSEGLIIDYPIKPNPQVTRFWNRIEDSQRKRTQQSSLS